MRVYKRPLAWTAEIFSSSDAVAPRGPDYGIWPVLPKLHPSLFSVCQRMSFTYLIMGRQHIIIFFLPCICVSSIIYILYFNFLLLFIFRLLFIFICSFFYFYILIAGMGKSLSSSTCFFSRFCSIVWQGKSEPLFSY
jgi:hypothetical protein